MAVSYLDELSLPYNIIYSPVERVGMFCLPGQGVDGYGDKITTDRMVKIGGRKLRVYCTQWSNVSSCWVTFRGSKYYLRATDY